MVSTATFRFERSAAKQYEYFMEARYGSVWSNPDVYTAENTEQIALRSRCGG